jgi:NAD(P)-dependent dehydrogenase (short-subunit alcohol dehydrogenase family)
VGRWTAEDIPDQRGRTAVVTGANSGLGFVTARELARRGARVVMAVRDRQRGEDARRRLVEQAPGADVALEELDLADLDSVRAFTGRLGDDTIDVLVNNAGVMALPRRETRQGFELQLGTNHLGHFALTGLLLGRVLAAGHDDVPRVVTVSSNAHKMGRINFDDLHGRRRYFRWFAYGQAKLANLLFALELQRRADAAAAALLSVAAHPGYAATNLQYQSSQMTGNPLDRMVNRVLNATVAQSDESGALPLLYAATVPDLPGGAYVGPDGPGEFRGSPRLTLPNGPARDPDAARRLWEVSEELTGVRYAFDRAGAAAYDPARAPR